MRYKIYADRIKLLDSSFVRKSMFRTEIERIRSLHPTCRLWIRSDNSIRREWAAHNWAYSLGIKRDKTADVDLDFEQKWYVKLGYFIMGSIALLIIK
jgi:hypothetical protein